MLLVLHNSKPTLHFLLLQFSTYNLYKIWQVTRNSYLIFFYTDKILRSKIVHPNTLKKHLKIKKKYPQKVKHMHFFAFNLEKYTPDRICLLRRCVFGACNKYQVSPYLFCPIQSSTIKWIYAWQSMRNFVAIVWCVNVGHGAMWIGSGVSFTSVAECVWPATYGRNRILMDRTSQLVERHLFHRLFILYV